MSSAHRPVSVVTTVLDEVDGIAALLGHLTAQARSTDEIVVVDGGSTDGTRELVVETARRDPRIRLVDAPGANIPRGRNVGIEAAGNDVICCTDAGCTPVPGWLDALRVPFDGPRPPDLATGIYRVASSTPVEHALALAGYPYPADAHGAPTLVALWSRLFGRSWDPTMPTGRSVAFTREAWDRVGGFPEHLDTGEDVVFGRRIAATGRAVLVPDAEVTWAQRPSLRATARMYRRYGVGGGRSDDPRVVGRDLVRAVAYLAAPLFLRRGRRAVGAVLGALYVSVPTVRALRDRGVATALLVPPAVALKDVSKAVGVVQGLTSRHPGADIDQQ